MKHYKKGVLILALTGAVLGLYGCGTDTGKATDETGTVTIGDADSLYVRKEASTDFPAKKGAVAMRQPPFYVCDFLFSLITSVRIRTFLHHYQGMLMQT